MYLKRLERSVCMLYPLPAEYNKSVDLKVQVPAVTGYRYITADACRD